MYGRTSLYTLPYTAKYVNSSWRQLYFQNLKSDDNKNRNL